MPTTDSLVDRLMQDAEALLLGLLNNARIGVYVIQDLKFLFVNQRMADVFGYTQDELCSGMGPLELFPDSERGQVENEHRQRRRQGRPTTNIAFSAVRKDGSRFDAEVFGVLTHFSGRPAIIGMLVDISARRRAEQAAAEHAHFIAQLLEAIPNAVFYKDEAGRYLGCNAAFEAFTGKTHDELLGHTVFDIAPAEQAEGCAAGERALLERGGQQSYESVALHADGSQRDVMVYKATFNKPDGRLGGLVGVILDISERKRMEEAIWREANYDALTGLPNLRMLRDRLKEEIKRAQRNGSLLALLFIDLDRFKEVNDTLGHTVGDLLLGQAAQRISATLRATDTVARQGGDEFVVILPALAEDTRVDQIAAEIQRSLAQAFMLAGQTVYVSASIGIAVYPDDSGEIDTLLACADQAMYAAKALGRNDICRFDGAMLARVNQRREVGNALREALNHGQLDIHYQPIVELASGRIVKAEALVRWSHPLYGRMEPNEFIPVAEEAGLIGDIGDWVFLQALETAFRWRTQNDSSFIQIGVNLSRQQIVSGRCTHWLDLLREAGLPPQALAVEIAENLLLDPRPAVVETLQTLRDAGMPVSVDDFGTASSALTFLRKLAIEAVKIDRSIVRDLGHDPDALAVCEAIIAMAHRLGMKTVAEGVETEEQRRLLRQAGCDQAQGYLFAAPMPRDVFQDATTRRAALPDAA